MDAVVTRLELGKHILNKQATGELPPSTITLEEINGESGSPIQQN
jgi:hypothetical protein